MIRSEIRIEFLVVVAVPRHEGDDDVLAERQFAHIGRRTIGDDLALADRVAHLHQRTLVDAGVLVRALELAHAVDVDARIARFQVFRRAHNDTLRIDLVDDARALRHDGRTRIAGHDFFDAGADQRRLGLQQRHRLTLHVRAHQRAVGVVVFKERDQRGRDRDQLLRRDVDQVDHARSATACSRRTCGCETRSFTKLPFSSRLALACATVWRISSVADMYCTSSVTWPSSTLR